MSTAEIAALRSTSEGTVKAQTNAIYRKAGVTGRSQLAVAVHRRSDARRRGGADRRQQQGLRPLVGRPGFKVRMQR
jgi:hypothetical protein